jgi:hypothetical protein
MLLLGERALARVPRMVMAEEVRMMMMMMMMVVVVRTTMMTMMMTTTNNISVCHSLLLPWSCCCLGSGRSRVPMMVMAEEVRRQRAVSRATTRRSAHCRRHTSVSTHGSDLGLQNH